MNTIKLDDPFSKYPVKPKLLTDKSDRSEGDGEEGGGGLGERGVVPRPPYFSSFALCT